MIRWRRKQQPKPRPVPDGTCPIREHTGDGGYVGRCDFAIYNGICPRHGVVDDYPNLDDRDVQIPARRHTR